MIEIDYINVTFRTVCSGDSSTFQIVVVVDVIIQFID